MSSNNTRPVMQVTDSTHEEIAPGFTIRRALPVRGLKRIDPFLLLDHVGPMEMQPGEMQGVPAHPHRGFEAVSYSFDGALVHRDSQGNHEVLRAGDVQWMTAGAGIMHEEMPEEEFRNNGGRFHAIQLWVNLPAQHKMVQAHYQHIEAARLPVVWLNNGVSVKIIAGEFVGQVSPIETYSPLIVLHCTLHGADAQIPMPAAFHAFAYIAEGEALFGEERKPVSAGQLVLFGDGETIALHEGDSGNPATILLFGGTPLNEPVFTYGPFVMNSFEEIQQAIRDYEQGKMGRL